MMPTRPGGAYTDYQHDTLNRLTSIANRTSGNALINSNDFVYNDLDLIGTETQNTSTLMTGFTGGVTTFDYNQVNQLISSQNPNRSFEYDEDGNMVKGYTPQGYVFTAVYDGANRLTSITHTTSGGCGGIVSKKEFVYGADSFVRIVREYNNGEPVSELRILRNGSLPLQDRNQDNAVVREYAWGKNAGGGIGGLLAMRQNNNANYYYLYDGKGNVSAVIGGSQAMVASYRYDTFGRLMAKAGPLDQPFQFSTKRYFADIGLNYYGYRFYSPVAERWMNRDPLGEAGGINLYGFVQNDPVNLIDPFGLDTFSDVVIGAVTGGIGGAATGGADGVSNSMVTGAVIGALVSNPYSAALIGVAIGVFGADDLGVGSDYSLERQREDIEIQEKLEEARRIREALEDINDRMGGNPCP